MRAPGFTLVETLVVLVIVALAATAVPRLWGAGQGGLIRAAAEDIAALLRETRAEARRTGRDTRVLFDTTQGSFQRLGGGRTGRIPAGASLVVTGVRDEADQEGRIALRFDAEGGSTGGRVRVAQGSTVAVVEIDWMTGLVRAAP